MTIPAASPPRPKTEAASSKTSRLADGALCAWFVLTAVAFWGPYAGIALPFNILTALYAAFLLFFIAGGALRLLRQQNPSPVPAASKERRRGK